MPTSTAVDRVARSLNIPCHETPTGWKYFCNLMDAGLCTICGEESFGTGSDHIREKDGLWAALCWLSILAARRRPVAQVVRDHWRRFGRSYFQRSDYEALDSSKAEEMLAEVRNLLAALVNTALANSIVRSADDFSYTDPVDGATASHQGIRVLLADGSRIVCRLSGTGTEGATLRLYLEHFLPEGDCDMNSVLAPLAQSALGLLKLRERFGREQPNVTT